MNGCEISRIRNVTPRIKRDGQAQYVFVSKYHSDQWPPEYDVIARSKSVRQVYDDGYDAIFEIVRHEKTEP